MNKKKLLWISHLVPYPPKGGVLQRAYNLIKEASNSFDIHLVSFVQGKLINTHFENYDHGLALCKEHLLQYCTQVDFFDIPQEKNRYGKYVTGVKGLISPNGYNIEWLRSSAFKQHLQQLSQYYQLVHFDTISLAIYANIFPDAKKILDHHNIESHMLVRRAENENNLIKKIYFYSEGKKLERFERNITSQFGMHITCSELDTQRLLKINPALNIKAIANGVDIEYFHPLTKRSLPDPNDFKIIFAGRLNAYTNDQAARYIAFELWPEMRTRFPGSKLYLVGQNPSEEITQKMESDERFFITGFVDDIRTFIDDADIYICPITDGGGTKLKVLDALAMGIPLVANKIACEGICTVNKESVLYADTTQQYLENIQLLLNETALYEKLSSSGIKLVKNNYSFSEIGKQLTKVYQNM